MVLCKYRYPDKNIQFLQAKGKDIVRYGIGII